MELLAAAFLGVVQGLTEFLPVSSSAHLVLVPWIFGWKPEGLVFDVALHVGTAVAVLAYLWRDWVTLAREGFAGLFAGDPFGNAERRLAWYLVIGTIPGAAAGLLFENFVDEHLRSPVVIVATLVVFGLILYLADRASRQSRHIGDFRWGDSIAIGLSQALALVPGVSRSGITISTAMFRDADRSAAARFSFLLSTPIIAGAGLKEGLKLVKAAFGSAHSEHVAWSVLFVGLTSAAITGFLCIRFFLRYVQTRSLTPFVVYRMALAVLVLALWLQHR